MSHSTSLRGYIENLERLADTPEEEFLSDRDKIASAKYHFVVSIECCLDIANHVIAEEGFAFPETNVDSFLTLTDNGWLPEEMRDDLSAMTKFRNRLVHLYWKIDDTRVYQYLQDSVTDLRRFVSEIARRLR